MKEEKEVSGFDIKELGNQVKSSEELMRLEILYMRYYLILSVEEYERRNFEGYYPTRERINVIVNIRTLFRELRPLLMRKHPAYKALEYEIEQLNKNSKANVQAIADRLLLFMDEQGLTKIDLHEPVKPKGNLED